MFGEGNWANKYYCQIYSLPWATSSPTPCHRVRRVCRVLTQEETMVKIHDTKSVRGLQDGPEPSTRKFEHSCFQTSVKYLRIWIQHSVPIPGLSTPIPASNAREWTIFSPEHSCILTMGDGRFLQSRSQAVKNHGVVFHFQAPGPGHRLEMKIWVGWRD